MPLDNVKPHLKGPAATLGRTADSFVNFEARLGWGAGNVASGAQYAPTLLSRNRQLLEWAYRGSWIVGAAVDCVAEDMTRAGIEIKSDSPPEDDEKLQVALQDLAIWQSLTETIKWARLYGGAVALLLIDGQKPATPLRYDTVRQDQFKGLLVLDRWVVQPSVDDLITELGPDLGQPTYYDIIADAPALPRMRIHHSRVLRFDGLPLPYYQKMSELGWGQSVLERLYDRLLAFDSASLGAAQLVYKAHLRTYKVPQLRELIAVGGKSYEAFLKQIEHIRRFQSNEGLTLLDAADEFETHQYAFGGLSDVILQFGQQLAGALQIPLVRLFGQSPAGLNATGESDLRTYYDGINQQQEARMRRPVHRLLEVLHRSVLGRAPPNGFSFRFNPLWQMSAGDKAQVAATVTQLANQAYDGGIVSRETVLKELRQQADVTGIWHNITDEEIEAAKDDPPPGAERALALSGGAQQGETKEEIKPGEALRPPKESAEKMKAVET
jgi:phage-related protein (TIGR01555 family)